VTALYPFLLAAARVLYHADRNPGYYTLGDLAIVLAVVLAALAAVYALAAWLLRGRDRGLPALVTFLAVLWLFAFYPVASALPRVPHHAYYVLLLGLGLIGSVLVVRRLAGRPETLRRTAVFLTLTGTLLGLWFGAGVVLDQWREREQVAGSELVRRFGEPIRARDAAPVPTRDVYLIVLDEYANADVMGDGLSVDISPFIDSLRALGFHVPKAVWSNYTMTMHSLPSLLNAAHVYPISRELPPGSSDPTLEDHLLAESRVTRFIQTRGYRVVFFPSLWWLPTRAFPLADSTVRVWKGFDLDRELTRTDFRRSLSAATPLNYLHRDEPWDGDFVRRTLEGVGRLPSVHAPVFAVAHVLSPHGPFAFDHACHLLSRSARGRGRAELYAGQVVCLNRLLLATVTRLLRDSKVPPIILLQGDHGSPVHGFFKAPSNERVSATAAWERFGAFGAYYLPAGGAAAFGDTVSVVNVLGNVLRHYFHADLPREPDDRYLSVVPDRYRFTRVDPAWIAGGDAARRPGSLAGAVQRPMASDSTPPRVAPVFGAPRSWPAPPQLRR
jgi:sulfatase-like protein